MEDFISKEIIIDDAEIFYRLQRSCSKRKVLVLIHGLASNMTRWSEFSEFTRLCESWDILLIDLRGHGHSQYRGTITMERWCSDIAAILDFEGYKCAVIGGHCLGANIAINFAALYPELCRGLVLLEPLSHDSFTGMLKKIKSRYILLKVLISFVHFLNLAGIRRRKIPYLDLRELDRGARKLIEEAGTAEVLKKRYGSPLHDLRYISSSAYLQSVRELLRSLPAIDDLSIPKLYIFSSGRLFSEPAGIDDKWSITANSETVIIDSYHWVPTEKPVELREAIEKWCGKNFP